jgi:hypothetical protein
VNFDKRAWASRWLSVVRDVASWPSAQLVLAALLVSGALADLNGRLAAGPLLCVTGAAVFALLAARRARPSSQGQAPSAASSRFRPLLLAGAIAFLYYYLLRSRSFPYAPALYAVFTVAALALAVELPLVARALARRKVSPETLRLWIWLACGAAFGFLIIHGTPSPEMDVWTVQQEAAAALLRGQNPYSISYRNFFGSLWHDGMLMYHPDLADARQVHVFIYPPLSVLTQAPSLALFGDVRWTNLAAVLVAAWALARLAPSGTRDLAAALVLFHPATRHQLLYGWTEPIVLAPALLMALGVRSAIASDGRRWVLAAVGMGLLAGSKQYSPLLLVPFAAILPRRNRWAALLLAAAVFLAGVLPFMVWDLRGLLRGNILNLMKLPFRSDSLSWNAVLMRLGAPPVLALAGGVLALAALVRTWPRRRSAAQAAACASASFGLTLVTGKQAFANYYWLWSGLLFGAALLRAGEDADGRQVPGGSVSSSGVD